MKRALTPVQAETLAACKIPYKSIAENLGVTIGAVRDYFNSKEKRDDNR